MPINIELHENFDGTLDGRYKQGDKPAPSSGGTPALAWSAPQGLNEGSTLTITTDGTNPFGATGPNFIALIDAYELSDGEFETTSLRLGSGVSVNYSSPETNGKLFVESVPVLGRGWRVGTSQTFAQSTEGTTYPQLRFSHPSSTRLFESRMSYYPTANSDNAASVLALTDNTNRWGVKPIWNMAQLNEDLLDTDFYIVGMGTGFDHTTNKFLGRIDAASNSSSLTSGNMNFTPLTSPIVATGLPFERKFDDVYFIEAAVDQGSADGVTLDAELSVLQGRANGGANNFITKTGQKVSKDTGAVKVISAFNYPGFVRGYSIPENAHYYETDLYKANGAGAYCRVAITNNSDYFQATKRALLEPISWSNSSVSMRFRSGVFQGNLAGCYINIVGIDNTQIGSIAI